MGPKKKLRRTAGRPAVSQSEAHREAILEVATRVFLERGFSGASMTEIARRAGASKGTLYALFPNKTELFVGLFRRRLAKRISQIVASTLEHEVKDPRLAMVTITDTRITPDLREATVYYTVYGGEAERSGSASGASRCPPPRHEQEELRVQQPTPCAGRCWCVSPPTGRPDGRCRCRSVSTSRAPRWRSREVGSSSRRATRFARSRWHPGSPRGCDRYPRSPSWWRSRFWRG